MKAWKTAAIAAVLITVTAAGVAVALPPRAQAQEALVAVAPDPPYVDVDVDFQGVLALGRGRLGVTVRDVNDDDAKKAAAGGGARGVVIEQVSDESAAQQAGLKAGDLVVEFDGERVRSAQQFTRLVQETPVGRSVPVVVLRDGQKTTLTVQPRDSWAGFRDDLANRLRYELPSRIVTPRPPTPPRAVPPTPAPAPEPFIFSMRGGTAIGVTVTDMSDQLGEYFGAKDGALVTSVTSDSPAARAGVKAGDVITAINGQEMKVPSDVRRAAQRLSAGAEFTIDVLRDKKKLTLKGKTEARQSGRRIVV